PWQFRACPWQKRASRKHPWGHSTRSSWLRQFSAYTFRWSSVRRPSPSSHQVWRKEQRFLWPYRLSIPRRPHDRREEAARISFAGLRNEAGGRDRACRPPPGTCRWADPRLLGRCRSEEHTSELQSRGHLVCRLLLEKKNVAGLAWRFALFRDRGRRG